MTPMYDGIAPTGGGLLPPVVVQAPLHFAGGLLVGTLATFPAKPLNADGATPPERLLKSGQRSPHHVNVVRAPAAATVLSPSTNAPRLGKAKTTAVLAVSEEGA